jgi:PPK2 family polyphosphate:nucleotide phosphotransferase
VPFDVAKLRVPPGGALRLRDRSTDVERLYRSKKDYEKRLAAGTERLAELQRLLWAHDRYALLVILQAMDAGGKDGAIRHVLSGVNPQGCEVTSFGRPSAEELGHDFLWRTVRQLPERGKIGVFNRSYYEEVLVVRVRPEVLAAQKLPAEVTKRGEALWRDRYRSIVDHEAHLVRNGTRVVKLFLHVSHDEQRKRLLARIDDPEKSWKFNADDLAERALWDDYRRAYEKALSATSAKHAPWYVIPADDKRNARLLVSRVLVETLEGLDMGWPKPDAKKRDELGALRKTLEG